MIIYKKGNYSEPLRTKRLERSGEKEPPHTYEQN